jgi:hypothetical protein
MPNEVFQAQIALLVRVLPYVAAETCFALKGGTAINLFVRDLPRLSVDIDLVYVPIQDRETSLREIWSALARIAQAIRKSVPGSIVTENSNADADGVVQHSRPPVGHLPIYGGWLSSQRDSATGRADNHERGHGGSGEDDAAAGVSLPADRCRLADAMQPFLHEAVWYQTGHECFPAWPCRARAFSSGHDGQGHRASCRKRAQPTRPVLGRQVTYERVRGATRRAGHQGFGKAVIWVFFGI